jgi:hypothetical protein
MKYLVLVILFIFVATYVFPQQDELTLEQLDEFFDSRITIIDYIGKKEVEPQPLSTKWRAYQGEKRLSERDFFLMTGYELEAKQAGIYHLGSFPLIISSPIVCCLAIKVFSQLEIDFLTGIGVIFWIIEMPIMLLGLGSKMLVNTRFPYSRAEVIMNEYNEKLLEEIKEK